MGELEPKDALVEPSGPAGENPEQQRGARLYGPSNGVYNPLVALDLLLVESRKTSSNLPSIGRSASQTPIAGECRGGFEEGRAMLISARRLPISKQCLPTGEGGMDALGFMFRKVTESALT